MQAEGEESARRRTMLELTTTPAVPGGGSGSVVRRGTGARTDWSQVKLGQDEGAAGKPAVWQWLEECVLGTMALPRVDLIAEGLLPLEHWSIIRVASDEDVAIARESLPKWHRNLVLHWRVTRGGTLCELRSTNRRSGRNLEEDHCRFKVDVARRILEVHHVRSSYPYRIELLGQWCVCTTCAACWQPRRQDGHRREGQ